MFYKIITIFFIIHVDIDECSAVPCEHNGTCSNNPGSYNCKCEAGWNGLNCQTGTKNYTLTNFRRSSKGKIKIPNYRKKQKSQNSDLPSPFQHSYDHSACVFDQNLLIDTS